MTYAARGLALVVAGILGFSSAAARAGEAYTVDAVHSSVVFRVKHLNTSHTWGRFDSIAGTFALDPADASGSKLSFTIKAASVNTNNKDRDNHLKSPDFFNAVQYPNITFASESVTKTEKGYDVKGNLTLHGVTKPIQVLVVPVGNGKDMKGNPITGIDTTFVVKQSDFGITKMAAAVGDEVTIFVSLEGGKN